MTATMTAAPKRKIAPARESERLRGDKVGARRIELAEAALATLGELGYARTSLREIAQKSEFSHGVLHYYFSDKVDLICCSVRHYKSTCATRYDAITASAKSAEELVDGFLTRVAETMRNEAPMHRLWYDLRSQALYEDAFRQDVREIDEKLEAMVWRVATRYAELRGKTPAVSSSVLYALMDGLFQKYLLAHLSGDESAADRLVAEVRPLFGMVA